MKRRPANNATLVRLVLAPAISLQKLLWESPDLTFKP